MMVFVWERVDDATENWHPEGGLVVVAADLDAAREALRGKVPDKCEAFSDPPDHSYALAGDEPVTVIVFPDAGCC